MKKLWVNLVPYEKGLAIGALESGTQAVVRQFGKIKTGKRAV